MSNWIDAHIHLTDPRLQLDLAQVLVEAERAGISRFILGGIEPEEWERQKELARAYPERIFPVFGLHPWWVATADAGDSERGLACLRAEAGAVSPRCRAIGETGLDFHPRFSSETHAHQEAVFRAHLRLALETGMPLVLHVVRAHSRALEILAEEQDQRIASEGGRPSSYTGIVHSFSDEPAIARAYLGFGLLPSISAPVITRGSGGAFEKLRQTVVTLAATEFVLETDAPDQPPTGETGVNAPTNLVRVAEAVARIRATKFPAEGAGALLDQSAENLRRIFRIEKS